MGSVKRWLVLCVLLVGCAAQAQAPEYVVYLPTVNIVHSQGAGGSYGNCGRIRTAELEWYYDWSPEPPICGESVPMIWSAADVGLPLGGNSAWVLGGNELDQQGIDPATWAVVWRQVEHAYPDKRLVSPAASVGWLTDWWNEYT